MGFTTDIKNTTRFVIFGLIILMIFIIPWSAFITLPDFLAFLNNTTLMAYFNKHSQLVIYLIVLILAFLLPITIWNTKR